MNELDNIYSHLGAQQLSQYHCIIVDSASPWVPHEGRPRNISHSSLSSIFRLIAQMIVVISHTIVVVTQMIAVIGQMIVVILHTIVVVTQMIAVIKQIIVEIVKMIAEMTQMIVEIIQIIVVSVGV